MLFNSFAFLLLFMPVATAGFFFISHRSHRAAQAWLVLASLFFYGYWNPNYVPLLVVSIVGNFACGTILSRPFATHRRLVLIVGLAANLLVLGFFKYGAFSVASLDWLTGFAFTIPKILLPLGISFYSFTQIAYLVDAYDGKVRESDALRYFVFVTYFPHLIAGPVLHHQQVMPQFAKARTYRWNWNMVALGVAMFTIGLAKKVLLADTFADYANAVFNNIPLGTVPKLLGAWAGALAFSFQLYFDFSGYSDMAVGLSLFFNVRLPFNFNSPYKAVNIVDFWRRWHMTLSTFLRDYLYIRLGGNRHGEPRRLLNLMATMLIGGLWHGASWTFVAWGGLHGIFLVANHLWHRMLRTQGVVPRQHRGWSLLSSVLTFLLVTLAWVLFRSNTFLTAQTMFQSMAGLNGLSVPHGVAALVQQFNIPVTVHGLFENNLTPYASLDAARFVAFALMGSVIVWALPNSQELVMGSARSRPVAFLKSRPRTLGVLFACLFCLVLSNLDRVSTFLYYQF